MLFLLGTQNIKIFYLELYPHEPGMERHALKKNEKVHEVVLDEPMLLFSRKERRFFVSKASNYSLPYPELDFLNIL